MKPVSQTKAARCVGRDPRTIRRWIQQGKLRRRKHQQVALEDVERLARNGNQMKKRGMVGGYSGGRISYSYPGRPPGTLPSPWILRPDADGHCCLWGKPLQVNADTPSARDLTDVERLLEIRVLGWVWDGIKPGYTANQIWKLLPYLRDRHTSFLAGSSPLPIETTLFHILRDTPPREIFVITARLVYDHVNHATGDATPRDIQRPLPVKWNPKKEPLNAYLQRYFGQKPVRDDQDKDWSVKLTDEERRLKSLKTIDDHTATPDESLFRLATDHPNIQLPPAKRKEFEAWKNQDETAYRETKHGQRMSGMEEHHGKIRPVRLKRSYKFGNLLGTSHRMATYWKHRTAEKYKQVRSELEKIAPMRGTTADNDKQVAPALKRQPPIRGTSAEAEAYVERALLAPEPKFNPEILRKLPVEIIETVLARLKSQGRLTAYDKALARYNRAILEPEKFEDKGSGDEGIEDMGSENEQT